MVDTCAITGFDSLVSNSVIPTALMAAVATTALIGLSYAVGNAIANSKLTLWAKTEAVQIVISMITIGLLLSIMGTYCSLNISDIAGLFNVPGVGPTIGGQPANMYNAAQQYLLDSAHYANNALTVIRYHLEAYNVMAATTQMTCDFKISGTVGIGCLFGYSGVSSNPLGGYAAAQAALNIAFNSAIMSQMSALNFLFILLFVYKGFVLLFLPLGVLLRSMPYLRTFGALLIATAISFLIVYPFMLAIFYVMEPVLLDSTQSTQFFPAGPPDLSQFFTNEHIFKDEEGSGFGMSSSAAVHGASAITNTYFPNGDAPIQAMAFAGYAFLAAVFLPTVALLATIGSIVYMTRLYGEEIDLSRIVQMV